MDVEINRVFWDGFYDEDKKIIEWVKNKYNFEYMGVGISFVIRILVFKFFKVDVSELGEWGNKFDEEIKEVFLGEKFI